MDTADNGAEFHCLAFAPVKYRQGRQPRMPASLAVYFCTDKSFTRFSRHSFGENHYRLSYTRGVDDRDTLEFLFLLALLEDTVHPAAWRLFPRAQIPPNFRSDEYETARKDLCHLLYQFRSREMVARLTAKMRNEPLMIFDDSFGRVASGDSKEEDDEIEIAVMEKVRAQMPPEEE